MNQQVDSTTPEYILEDSPKTSPQPHIKDFLQVEVDMVQLLGLAIESLDTSRKVELGIRNLVLSLVDMSQEV